MKILITGSNGFLGCNLTDYLCGRGIEVFATDLMEDSIGVKCAYLSLDLTRKDNILKACESIQPQVIINTVAIADVDKCEKDKKLAYKINVNTAENIASVAKSLNARLIHISTDQLFKGDESFYREESLPEPINYYGTSKWEAEKKVLWIKPDSVVIRTNFYGWSSPQHKPTFAEWLYGSLKSQKAITLFTDYYFTPIEVGFFIRALEKVIFSDYRGIINIAGSERCSKYDFGLKMASVFHFDTSNVSKGTMRQGSFIAPRPADLSLSIDKYKSMFDVPLPGIFEGINLFKQTKPKYAK